MCQSIVPISGLPHLAVSSSTPPPSTSPMHIKVKSEPVSPPREQHHSSIMGSGGGGGHNSSGGSGSVGGGDAGGSGSGSLSVTTMNNVSSNISVLNHHQHLVMSSRPNSTGHLTPTPGKFLALSICNIIKNIVLGLYVKE